MNMLSATIPVYEVMDEDEKNDPDNLPTTEVENLASLGDFLKLPKNKRNAG